MGPIPILDNILKTCRTTQIVPSLADKPPRGSNWVHEIKHDGYRLMGRRDPVGIAAADPPRQRLVQPLPANRGGCEPPQGEVLPHRWQLG